MEDLVDRKGIQGGKLGSPFHRAERRSRGCRPQGQLPWTLKQGWLHMWAQQVSGLLEVQGEMQQLLLP